jgi:hypothetical protein
MPYKMPRIPGVKGEGNGALPDPEVEMTSLELIVVRLLIA